MITRFGTCSVDGGTEALMVISPGKGCTMASKWGKVLIGPGTGLVRPKCAVMGAHILRLSQQNF